MGRHNAHERFRATAAALCLFGWVGASHANPPANLAPGARGAGTAQSASARTHLDLTPPSLDTIKSTLMKSTFEGLQPMRRNALSLGDDAWLDRPSARMAELVRRVHREGLPVARLWENRSALLSLGLNQRGKPGLWIIQKTQ
jgi:hypothetical protein